MFKKTFRLVEIQRNLLLFLKLAKIWTSQKCNFSSQILVGEVTLW